MTDKVWHLEGEQFCQQCIRNARYTNDEGEDRYEIMGEDFAEEEIDAAEETATLCEDWGDE